MSQPTDPTRPSDPRDPGAPTPQPGRRVSDSRHTFPADAPAPPSAPPPAASATGSGAAAGAPQTQRSPLVPQIGSPGDDRTGGSAQNPYGAAGARYSSETPPPAAGLATGAIPRVNPAQSSSGQSSAQYGAAQPQAGAPGMQQPGQAGTQQPGQVGAGDHPGHGAHAPATGPIPHSAHAGQMPPSGPDQRAAKPRRRGPGWGALHRGRRCRGRRGRGTGRRGRVAPVRRCVTGRLPAVEGLAAAVGPHDQPVDGDARLGADRRPDLPRRHRDPGGRGRRGGGSRLRIRLRRPGPRHHEQPRRRPR